MVMMECLPPMSASEVASPSPPCLPPPPPPIPQSTPFSSSCALTDHLVLRVRHRERKKKGGRGGGRVEKQGNVTVLETGALSEGHLAVVTLRRKGGREGGREGGWVVDKVEMEVLPSFRVGRERGER